MPSFSASSRAALDTAHPILIDLFERVVKHHDCKILEGVRTIEQQREYVRRGVSQTMDSRHLPRHPETGERDESGVAWALDVAPYPVDWQDHKRFHVFAGFVIGMFTALQATDDDYEPFRIRWGGDWDSDWTYDDQSFVDLPHFELRFAEQ